MKNAPPTQGAFTKKQAAQYLAVSEKTIYRLAAMGEIAKTFYGTYPLKSLDAHLEREIGKLKS